MNTAHTPREILARLDEFIVGQTKAKRAVAVALRNRWRRRQLDPSLAEDVYPKNILLIGPTGVGKTEIARRLASLARAPFVKVEASKYSEVGYQGRDVESMIRDLMDTAIQLVQSEHAIEVAEKAKAQAEERIFESLAEAAGIDEADEELAERPFNAFEPGMIWRPGQEFGDDEGTPIHPENVHTSDFVVGNVGPEDSDAEDSDPDDVDEAEENAKLRRDLRRRLDAGELETRIVEIELVDNRPSPLTIMGPQGTDAMGIDTTALQEAWGRTPVVKTITRKVTVAEARGLLETEEAQGLVDQDAVTRDALQRCENDGIVFIDEIDKVIGSSGGSGPDVSREGVQRDLLPVIEGCAVYTKYGNVRTDHILFIAAGAFHHHKPSELIPELQGRFPVRVGLRSLTEEDFVRILTEPRNSLVRQYQALFQTENVSLEFTEDGIARLAAIAFRANQITQDIGARRLMTILEKCLEELSFDAADQPGTSIVIDAALVDRNLGESGDDEDLIPYDL